MIKFKWW